ncbi:MAG: 4Fe-4S dicluster domain-containing protein [Firmicutes bacterium]|nr:4Fe-4S dicluster domain-containing protein [Bacillota bacterium]
MLTKPITVEYPFKKLKFAPVYRGGFCFYPDRCNACKSCQNACPNNVIAVTGERGEDKKMRLVKYEMDLQYCLYCGLCQESCNKDAITMTDHIDLATFDRGFLKMKLYEGQPPRPAATAPKTAGSSAEGSGQAEVG